MNIEDKAIIARDTCLHLIDILRENDAIRGTRSLTARQDLMREVLIIENELGLYKKQ